MDKSGFIFFLLSHILTNTFDNIFGKIMVIAQKDWA